MKILIVRHAPAGDRAAFEESGRPDSQRPLTAKGRFKMRQAARGLKRIVKEIDCIASSPLLRAKQTAEIVLRVYEKTRMLQISELAPDAKPEALLAWLRGRREKTIALAGHEPHLSRLIAYLCTDRTEPFLELKKGQVCLIKTPGIPRRGNAKLLWSLRPEQLRRLGK